MSPTVINQRLKDLGGLHPCIGPGSSGTRSPLSEKEISELEDDLGVRLPADYRQFLSEYGACRFKSIVSSHPDLYYRIAHFLGGGQDENDSGHIRGAIAVFEGRMPDNILPIAECDDGAICLGISKTVYGRIFYWDRENEWDWQQQERRSSGDALSIDEQFQNISELAESFEAFILDLQIVHPDE